MKNTRKTKLMYPLFDNLGSQAVLKHSKAEFLYGTEEVFFFLKKNKLISSLRDLIPPLNAF